MTTLSTLAGIDRRYLPTVFWFLNDRLEPPEIRRQIAMMSQANIGGLFLHARMGLLTSYLSEQWLACVEAAVKAAAERDLDVWIYDEDNWPSGYAGGRVLSLGDWTRQRYLRAELLTARAGRSIAACELDGIICAYSICGRGSETRILERLNPADHLLLRPSHPHTESVVVFHRELHRSVREFCPEQTASGYVNVFDPAVTDAFIASTYELYYERFAGYFGSTIVGFFFDEPQYHELGLWGDGICRFPWSESFPQVYRDSCGRDLLQDLPLLIWEIADFQEARYQYYRMLSEQFSGNFTARLYDWCEQHGVKLTGHVILEEFPRQAARCVGDPMAHYALSHVPGIDHLGKNLQLKAFWSSTPVLCKQVQSAAGQLGKERVLCELFAGAGNFFGMPDQKWLADWLLACGVNLLCYHAFHYSLRGYRKRDYPPTLNYQQPWFPYSAGLGGHFARIAKALCQGRRVVNVLLIHPMESFWATQSDDNFTGRGEELSESFRAISELLLHSGFDWDFGNEIYLERWGIVEGSRLKIADCVYRAVIVPPLNRMRYSTMELLQSFCRNGGLVLAIEACNAEGTCGTAPSAAIAGIKTVGKWNDPDLGNRIGSELRQLMPAQLEVLPLRSAGPSPLEELVFQERRLEEGWLYFIASSSRVPRRIRCRFPHSGAARSLDTISAEVQVLQAWGDGRSIELELELGGSRSQLIEIKDGPAAAVLPRIATAGALERRCIYGRETEAAVTIHEPNVLILDRADLSLGGRRQPGLFLREAAELIDAAEEGCAYRLDFPFTSTIDLSSCCLLVESPGAFAIALDGRPLRSGSRRWHIDIHLRLLPLPSLQAGSHCVSIEGCGAGREIEPLYLAGPFGVRLAGAEAEIVSPPATLRAGSWTEQGLPFYAGRITYHLTVPLARIPRSALICFPSMGEKDARVLEVNGRLAATCILPPFQADIVSCLRRGENSLEITVANHLRNFLGPHHIANEEEIDCFSPADFFAGEHFVPRYLLKPAGILGEAVLHLSWR